MTKYLSEDNKGYYELTEDGGAWYFELEPRKDGRRYAQEVHTSGSDKGFWRAAETPIAALAKKEKEEILSKCKSVSKVQLVILIRKHAGRTDSK